MAAADAAAGTIPSRRRQDTPRHTAAYVVQPKRWRHDRIILLPAIALEVCLVWAAQQAIDGRTVPGLLGAVGLLLPTLVAVERDGAGLLVALAGAATATLHSAEAWPILVVWLAFVWGVATFASHHRERIALLADRILMAEGEERRRIANDLHDDSVQVIVAALLRLESVEPEAKRHTRFQDAVRDLQDALGRLRAMSFQLRPPALEAGGLQAAVPDLCDVLTPRMLEQGASLSCAVEASTGRYAPATEELAHRVILEALHNVVRHAACTTCTVRVFERNGCLHADISDDGRGFDPATIGATYESRLHLGLPAKVERVEWAGGRLEIDATEGRGCTIRLTLPATPRT